MSTYVLVHGAWHGGWCWERVVPLLQASGHRVLAVDLPGHGANQVPIEAVTLDSYVNAIDDALDQKGEPVILVGHSMGGGVITQAAAARPEAVQMLVYLAGLVPNDGESLQDILSRDSGSLLLPNLEPAIDGKTVRVRESALAEVFYGDCLAEDVDWATAQLIPQPVAPVASTISLPSGVIGRIPKVGILTVRDRAISPELQEQMYRDADCQIARLDTAHCPFISAPEDLGQLLAGINAL